MIRSVNKCELERCVELIQTSFLTVAREYGFTRENAPPFYGVCHYCRKACMAI